MDDPKDKPEPGAGAEAASGPAAPSAGAPVDPGSAPRASGAAADRAAAAADTSATDRPAAESAARAPDTSSDKAAAKPGDHAGDKPGDKAGAKPADTAADTAAAKPARPAKPAEPEPDPGAIPSAPPWWRTLRADPPAYMRLVIGLGMIAVVLGVWWFLTRGGDEIQIAYNGRKQELGVRFFPSLQRIVPYVKIPSPGEVFGSLPSLLDRDVFEHLTASLQRVLLGIGLAALVGITFGILAAAHRGVLAAVMPIVIFLRSVPMGALVPLTLILFGAGEPQKRWFIFLAIVPFVFSDTVKAISVVPERYVETAQTLGATRFQIIRKVLVPLALPDVITSLRFQMGLGLGYIMLAEEIDIKYGLGKLITGSARQGPYEHAYMILFIIASVAFLIDLVLRTIQRGLFTWRKDL